MRVHRKNVVGLLPFVLFIILLLFNACTGESDSGSIGSTGSIIFSIRLDSPTIESTDRLATAINCAATGISTVEGEVFDESNSSIGFGIYYMIVNIGALIGPFIASELREQINSYL